MDSTEGNRRAFIEQLARANRESYGTPNGRSVLRAFELTFEHRWTYIFELIQNALDAGARSISVRIVEGGDALAFQHDGHRSMGKEDVEALSNVFRSTKGAATVGFMGVGFKSVFSRFQEARVSGWGWTFRYEITQITGEEYGDVQPELLGAVVPIWDDAIPLPDPGFTTRFEVRRRADAGANLKSDLAHFLPEDDPTPIAILAASGLQYLEMDDRVWEMAVGEERDGSSEVTARSDDENLLWQLFPVLFEPSKKAIARFLEHRRIQPQEDERQKVYADAARSRRVLGLLPMDDNGMPAPPARGRVYAALPTDVTLPFGLHINADWLLNISRSGVREIEGDAWQLEIVDRIADVLARFLGWASRSFSAPAAVGGAFGALASPEAESSGLEAHLAGEGWQSRLRDCLENAAVFPVWSGKAEALSFASSDSLIVPPAPLAKAFAEEADMRPAILLQGPVLRSKLIGADALDLLESIGLFHEMSPWELGNAWPNGLKSWWRALADEPERRQYLLFRIWAAVAALADDDAWRNVDLPCCRTVTGKWLPVREVVFLSERLPSKRAPGGPEVRQFIEPFIPDANRVPDKLVDALRQGAAKEAQERHRGTLSQAWNWFNAPDRRLNLRMFVADAMHDLMSSPSPDWSALVPLGHWAKSRTPPRHDLLILVQVDTENGPRGIPACEALLADPYVEYGQGRRRLFPTVPAISVDYLEQDPKHGNRREWRTFLEQASTKGALQVRRVVTHAHRGESKQASEFLGLLVGESNNSGYTLVDFDIDPSLPDQDAPKELRAALAPWLQDGLNSLRDKGKRQVEYFYYSSHKPTGNVLSAWVTKLSKVAWVPCSDSELRRPEDTLPQPDPTREGVPVATLSSELLSALEREGLKFGSAIPEATSLHKLLAAGARLDAEALAQLLRECREQITTNDDRGHFEQAVRGLLVPSTDDKRVSLDRVVRRAGSGERLRGALDGWVVSLDRIDEALRTELEHPDFPYRLPDTTTGCQALAYLRDVWKRAQVSPERLANAVRDVLPAAFAYCLEDCGKDASLFEQWQAAVPEVTVFADREWVIVANADDIYFDDLEDRRFFPSEVRLRTVTSGHLGNTWPAQIRAADAIGLPRLSSSVTIEWHIEDGRLPIASDWIPRFDLICELLRWVRRSDRVEGDRRGAETGRNLELLSVHGLALHVSVGSAPADRVPINARLHEGVLTVAGRPVQFAADAAKELLRHFSFGQRANLAADLTGTLGAIDNKADFILAVDKFQRSFARGFELPPMFRTGLGGGNTSRSEDRSPQNMGMQAGIDKSVSAMPLSNLTRPEKSRWSDNASAPDSSHVPDTSGHDESDSTGGSYTKVRALAKQNALADQLRNSLKGEIEPSADDDSSSRTTTTAGDPSGGLGDEVYRKVVALYEKEAGREPELGDPRQAGWDIRSIDPNTKNVRLIEVKGKGCPWIDDEVVEVSQAQAHKAWELNSAWYLYVVERTNDGSFVVLPIGNPVQLAGKWILCGQSWRMLAKESRRFTYTDLNSDC